MALAFILASLSLSGSLPLSLITQSMWSQLPFLEAVLCRHPHGKDRGLWPAKIHWVTLDMDSHPFPPGWVFSWNCGLAESLTTTSSAALSQSHSDKLPPGSWATGTVSDKYFLFSATEVWVMCYTAIDNFRTKWVLIVSGNDFAFLLMSEAGTIVSRQIFFIRLNSHPKEPILWPFKQFYTGL